MIRATFYASVAAWILAGCSADSHASAIHAAPSDASDVLDLLDRSPGAPHVFVQPHLDEGPLEKAYAAALRDATQAWSEHIHAGTGYALPLPAEGLDVQRIGVHIEHATLRLSVGARVWGPHKQVTTRNMERVARSAVSALAFDATEAEPLLMAACKSQMAATPLDVGDELEVVTTGPVELAGVEGAKPFRYGRYTQSCEAYATTVASCRESGVHPQQCTYVDGGPITVHRTLACERIDGSWRCKDEGEMDFPPPAAEVIAAALNEPADAEPGVATEGP